MLKLCFLLALFLCFYYNYFFFFTAAAEPLPMCDTSGVNICHSSVMCLLCPACTVHDVLGYTFLHLKCSKIKLLMFLIPVVRKDTGIITELLINTECK